MKNPQSFAALGASDHDKASIVAVQSSVEVAAEQERGFLSDYELAMMMQSQIDNGAGGQMSQRNREQEIMDKDMELARQLQEEEDRQMQQMQQNNNNGLNNA